MAQTTTGAPAKTYTPQTIKSCWANQIEKQASEDEDGKVRFLHTTEFIVRYDPQLIKGRAVEMLVVDEDQFEYNIIGVLNIVPKRYLQLNTIRRGQ